MKYLIPILLISFLSSCSDAPSAFDTGEFLETQITEGQLTVKNNSILPIYYFAVETELLAIINYALVSTEENKIAPFDEVEISLTDIGVTEPGQRVAFIYWTVREPEADDIESILIETE